MKKLVLLLLIVTGITTTAQTKSVWKKHDNTTEKIVVYKGAQRASFPKEFELFDLDITPLKQLLFSYQTSKIISLPNAEGQLEQFEMFEASNFEPDLQAQFPEIRAYSGKGITDKYATLKLSISPQGIQTMVFRTDKPNEFIEAYSDDRTVYAVFKSNRQKGALAWACSTEDQKLVLDLKSNFGKGNFNRSSAGQLKVMRLAQSCNAEYANYFGATSSAQVGLVLAAFNATLSRCNGCYEKDLAVHLNLVASTINVIYYVPASDPYTTMTNWNTQLQIALNTTLSGPGTSLAVNNAAYDIGHLFGASGGGGNAGCIGCVCVNGVAAGTGSTKGRGITSPSDGVPMGDTFDIDYVVHEMGHQMGGTHTFSNSNEGSGTNKEVGSGVTIMGYAGITANDVAPHSIDIYHETTIAQIQANLAIKSCPVTTSLSGTNTTPVVAAVTNYTIPMSTSFVLTGAATDADNDPITYCWEQNDDGGGSTGAASSAGANKTVGPNFITWPATASPLRYFPKIESVIANSPTTSQVGGDAGMLSEALSAVSRVLNFRLTVRDNCPYSSTAPIKVGQTAFTDMAVTVNSGAGPFVVNTPNTAVSWTAGTNETVTWSVAGTTGNGINAAFVDVFLSEDGGYTYPIQLANKVPNTGSTTVTVPNNIGSNNRIMVKGYQNIFFDISNANFSIAVTTSTFAVTESSIQSTFGCALTSTSYSFDYSALNGFAGTTTFAASGLPAGATATFSPTTMSSSNGTVTVTINNLTGAAVGDYNIVVAATSGGTTKNVPFYLSLGLSDVTLITPANNATAQSTSLPLTWSANPNATSFDYQIANDAAFTNIIDSGTVTSNNYNASGLTQATTYYWRVIPKNAGCTGIYSPVYNFMTGIVACASAVSTAVPVTIPTTVATVTSTLTVPSGANISDINVNVNISHTYVSDLTLKLTSPAGTQITLISAKCTSNDDIAATFDDAGTTLVCSNLPAIAGTILPSQALSGFNGQNATGIWTLTVVDGFNVDGGSINSWSLDICNVTPALGIDENHFENFVLYPNPNKGNFTVQFNSATGNDINIAIHDIQGRLIFDSKYNNTGLFNQNLQLNNTQSGVYLITIQDGDKKIVKRIVVE
jgi:subtilisin-like proprotein convertase family protein